MSSAWSAAKQSTAKSALSNRRWRTEPVVSLYEFYWKREYWCPRPELSLSRAKYMTYWARHYLGSSVLDVTAWVQV